MDVNYSTIDSVLFSENKHVLIKGFSIADSGKFIDEEVFEDIDKSILMY